MNAKRAEHLDHQHMERLRTLHAGPEAEALRAILARHAVLSNNGYLAALDPREIAGMVSNAGAAGELTGLPQTFETMAALALAGLMASVRAAELRIETGDAA